MFLFMMDLPQHDAIYVPKECSPQSHAPKPNIPINLNCCSGTLVEVQKNGAK